MCNGFLHLRHDRIDGWTDWLLHTQKTRAAISTKVLIQVVRDYLIVNLVLVICILIITSNLGATATSGYGWFLFV
jgi:hypothetical protein